MIKYKLVCNKCKNTFDSWFASSKEFEKLKKQNFLSCINCNSKKVDKSLMAPLIMKKSKRSAKKDEKNKHIKTNLKNIKNLLKTILNMLVKILHMKQELCIMIKKIQQKEYMEMQL